MTNPQGIIHLSHVEIEAKRFVRTGQETFEVKYDTLRGIVQSVDGGVAVVYWQTGETKAHRLTDLTLVRQ